MSARKEQRNDDVSVPIPTWLKVKTQVRAGGPPKDTGTMGAGEPSRAVLGPENREGRSSAVIATAVDATPTWLKVKSQIKSGTEDPKTTTHGTAEDDGLSPALVRLTTRTRSSRHNS